MKRYFHVSYSYPNGFGSVQIINNAGEYPYKKYIESIAEPKAIILNIVELTENDFNTFM